MSPAIPAPPTAPQVPLERTHHGDTITDPYAWMSDKSDPRLLDYLRAENDWTEQATSHLAHLREELYTDIAVRTQQTDLTVPTFVTHTTGEAFWYYTRTVEGLEYPIHCRVPAASRDDIPDASNAPADEQVLLDVNALAEPHPFCALGWCEVSPDGGRLGYALDTSGDERYDLVVLDLAAGRLVGEPITGVGAGGAWLGNDHLWYVRVDDAWRPHQVWRHEVGTPASDSLVKEERDPRFWLGVETCRGYDWAMIVIASLTTSEMLLLPTDQPAGEPRCVAARRDGVEYSVEVGTDGLYILHNDGAPQFMLSRAPLHSTGPDQWETLIGEDADVRLTGVTSYDLGLVISHRTKGMTGLSFLPRRSDGTLTDDLVPLGFREPLHTVDADEDPDFGADRIRIGYESMVSPPSVLEYNLATGESRVLKETPVLPHPARGAYEAGAYVQERLWATAPDGTQVPLSVVRRADVAVDGTAPCLLYGYGSYEASTNPFFSTSRLSLLDRGWVYAIAHVRGGGELGRPWYESGRMLAKTNTFTDFVACAEHLVATGYAAPDRVLAEGASAGGLLMGAVANLAPERFRAIHAGVPFVDPLTTILDPDLPLTVLEWEEWGNPLHDPETYAYIKAYSPYENVRGVSYPAILATTSLNDTRVEVTEPAKWVARLRERATNPPERPILLRTELDAGHGGVSGRYAAWRDRAFELAWLIDQGEG